MRFAQLLVTDDQVQKLRVATDMILQDEHYVLTETETADYQRLSMYFGAVLQTPSAFAPTGERATKVKALLRRAKVAQSTARPNKRKQRQEKRIAAQKARKAQRREDVADFNRVQALMEAERIEAEQARAELQERLTNEPRMDVLDMNGNVIVAGVPQSMLVPSEPEPTSMEDAAAKGLIILPASAEKALERAKGE